MEHAETLASVMPLNLSGIFLPIEGRTDRALDASVSPNAFAEAVIALAPHGDLSISATSPLVRVRSGRKHVLVAQWHLIAINLGRRPLLLHRIM